MSYNDTHEVRDLKYRNKQLGKELGRASERIFRLKGAVALYRDASDSEFKDEVERLRAENEQLHKDLNTSKERGNFGWQLARDTQDRLRALQREKEAATA